MESNIFGIKIKNGSKFYEISFLIILFLPLALSVGGLLYFAICRVRDWVNRSANNIYQNVKLFFSKLSFGYSYFGRIVMTLLSLEVVFFLYNIVFQSIILLAGLIIDMDKGFLQYMFIFYYILFILFSTNILIIPTYEFFNFPFLHYNNPFCHLYSFKYIIIDEEYNEEKYQENSAYIHGGLFILGIIFIISYLLAFIAKFFVWFKDLLEFGIVCFLFIYYITILCSYLLYSVYFFYCILKKILCKRSIILDFNFLYEKYEKRKKPLPDINLISHIINPY